MKEWLRRHVWDSKWGFGRDLFRVPLLVEYFNLQIKLAYAPRMVETFYGATPLFKALARGEDAIL